MRAVDLTTLRLRVRRRLDLEQDLDALGDPEIDDELNEGIARYYTRINRVRGSGYSTKPGTFPTVSGVAMYDLPGDFLELLAIACLTSSNSRLELEKVDFLQRGAYLSQGPRRNGWPTGYIIYGRSSGAGPDQMELLPQPTSPYTIELVYIPTPPKLLAPTNTLDGIAGYEEIPVLYAACKIATRLERFERLGILTTALDTELSRIDEEARRRDNHLPTRTKDTRSLQIPIRRRRWWPE